MIPCGGVSVSANHYEVVWHARPSHLIADIQIGQPNRPDYPLGVSAAVEKVAEQRIYSDSAIPHLQMVNTTRTNLWRCNNQPGMVTC